MKIREAIQRIGWRFGGNGNKNPFPVNENDIEAFNALSQYVEETQKQQYEANELFAKLFILVYAKMVEHYKTDILDDIPRKSIYALLKKPLPSIIDDFKDRLNDWTRSAVMENLTGEKQKHPSLQTEEEKQSSLKALESHLIDENNKVDYLHGAWEYEAVEACLIAEVNQAINLYR